MRDRVRAERAVRAVRGCEGKMRRRVFALGGVFDPWKDRVRERIETGCLSSYSSPTSPNVARSTAWHGNNESCQPCNKSLCAQQARKHDKRKLQDVPDTTRNTSIIRAASALANATPHPRPAPEAPSHRRCRASGSSPERSSGSGRHSQMVFYMYKILNTFNKHSHLLKPIIVAT